MSYFGGTYGVGFSPAGFMVHISGLDFCIWSCYLFLISAKRANLKLISILSFSVFCLLACFLGGVFDVWDNTATSQYMLLSCLVAIWFVLCFLNFEWWRLGFPNCWLGVLDLLNRSFSAVGWWMDMEGKYLGTYWKCGERLIPSYFVILANFGFNGWYGWRFSFEGW